MVAMFFEESNKRLEPNAGDGGFSIGTAGAWLTRGVSQGRVYGITKRLPKVLRKFANADWGVCAPSFRGRAVKLRGVCVVIEREKAAWFKLGG